MKIETQKKKRFLFLWPLIMLKQQRSKTQLYFHLTFVTKLFAALFWKGFVVLYPKMKQYIELGYFVKDEVVP